MIPLIDRLYRLSLPLLLRTDTTTAHHRFIETLRHADQNPLLVTAARLAAPVITPRAPLTVGGVTLAHPFIAAAGLVKGDGFTDEAEALAAVDAGRNIIPGWRALPRLVGAVEFGSFTRYPRIGNPGVVLWRDPATRSTQNRVGLRNPGAVAAAAFLARHRADLPPVYGINIAVSPGVDDPAQEKREALDALAAFTSRGVVPSWFTLNLSCPNTEDDPHGNQTTDKAQDLGAAMVAASGGVPVWVKVSPCLSAAQYAGLMRAFAGVGVRAVIATNTLAAPTPDGSATAGLGGGRLHAAALEAAGHLAAAREQDGGGVDIIGCGGVLDGASYAAFRSRGADAVQYYGALIYRSPAAAGIIYHELTLRSSQ